jgi:hypothetical protein
VRNTVEHDDEDDVGLHLRDVRVTLCFTVLHRDDQLQHLKRRPNEGVLCCLL